MWRAACALRDSPVFQNSCEQGAGHPLGQKEMGKGRTNNATFYLRQRGAEYQEESFEAAGQTYWMSVEQTSPLYVGGVDKLVTELSVGSDDEGTSSLFI